MNNDWLGISERAREEQVASFGGAQIVKHLDTKLEIRGGTEQEKAQAHAWIRRFLTRGRYPKAVAHGTRRRRE